MKLQVIEIETNKLVFDLEDSSKIPFLPSIGEIVIMETGPWIVRGVAHMWDRNLVKIMVISASKKD